MRSQGNITYVHPPHKAVDDSGSVSSSQFEMMRSCVRQLVALLPFREDAPDPPVRMALLQFSSKTHLITDFESSPGALATAMTGTSFDSE